MGLRFPRCQRLNLIESFLEIPDFHPIISRYTKQLTREADSYAKVAELVDALGLGPSGATRESSSLSFRTRVPWSMQLIDK